MRKLIFQKIYEINFSILPLSSDFLNMQKNHNVDGYIYDLTWWKIDFITRQEQLNVAARWSHSGADG